MTTEKSLLVQQESSLQEWGATVEKKAPTGNYDPEIWYSFDEGENQFRVVTPYKKYKIHSIKKDPNNPKDWGKDVKCCGEVKWVPGSAGKNVPVYIDGTCPACDFEKAELGKPFSKDKWVFGVYDYRTERYKVARCGYNIFNLIDTFSKHPNYGKPTQYDITITKGSVKKKPITFIPMPGPKVPLSAKAQAAVDAKIDLSYIEMLAASKTPAQIYRAMRFIRTNIDELFMNYGIKIPAAAGTAEALPGTTVEPTPVLAAKPTPKPAPTPKPTVTGNAKVRVVEKATPVEEDDGEFDFPSAD